MTARTVLLLLLMATTVQAQTYRWEDAGGGINFTDNYNDIPAQYRNKARLIEEPASFNVMPDNNASEKTNPTLQNRAKSSTAMANSTTVTRNPKKRTTARPNKQRHHQQQLTTPATPARQAQERNEEQLRQDRQKLDNSQRPARRAKEKNEEQIRTIRDGISGH